jgi:hypothetical protein
MPILFDLKRTLNQTRSSALRPSLILRLTLLTVCAVSAMILSADGARLEPAAFQDYSSKRLPVARIVLGPKGFNPAEITRAKDPFILSVHNRSKIDDLTLSLAKVTGNKLREMKFQKKKLDWRSFITLPPGDYALTVVGRPEWVCNIKIKGN